MVIFLGTVEKIFALGEKTLGTLQLAQVKSPDSRYGALLSFEGHSDWRVRGVESEAPCFDPRDDMWPALAAREADTDTIAFVQYSCVQQLCQVRCQMAQSTSLAYSRHTPEQLCKLGVFLTDFHVTSPKVFSHI